MMAAAYDLLIGPLERLWLARRRVTLIAPAAGRVLEIGVGTGLTFPHYRGAASVVGIDPDPAMLARARRRAAAAPVAVTLVTARAEALPFATGRFDAVVASLVLCSVGDPAAAAGEIRRVLRAGGELRLLEHVRSTRPWLARLQGALTPAWRRAFGNCHLDRDTVGTLGAAGFAGGAIRRSLGGLVVEGRVLADGKGRLAS